ncbi:vomeronasal type-2 receptor 26-like [Podarcis muralis]
MLLILLLFLLPHLVCTVHPMNCPLTDPLSIPHEWYQPNEFVIGMIVSQMHYIFPNILFDRDPSLELVNFPIVCIKFYQHIMASVFAINEIMGNPKLLPNVTLGFHIYDSCSNSRITYRTTLDMVCKSHSFFPNYQCGIPKNLIGVIGGLESDTSTRMADILGLYKIPQVGYAGVRYGKFP